MPENKEYVTVGKEIIEHINIVNKSKFISNITRVDDVSQATSFIKSISKKYFDATHNTFAYIIDNNVKFFDDNEPSQTAGKPILDAISKNNLDHVVVVVTRYFGGIKLGAGGLIRAYSNATSSVILDATKVSIRECVAITVTLPYGQDKVFSTFILDKAKVTNKEYSENVKYTLNVLAVDKPLLIESIVNFSNGKASIQELGSFLGEY